MVSFVAAKIHTFQDKRNSTRKAHTRVAKYAQVLQHSNPYALRKTPILYGREQVNT